MQISVNQSTSMRWTFDEDFIFYSNHSIHHAGLCLKKVDEFGAEKAYEMLDDLGIQASSLGTIGFESDILGPNFEDQIAEAKKAVRLASNLNAGCLLMHTGGPGGHLRKNRFHLARRAINRVLPYAEEFGVRLALEPLTVDPMAEKQFSHNLGDCIRLVDEFDSDYLGLNLDLFHVNDAWAELHPAPLEKVFLMQLSDFQIRGKERLRCQLGTGEMNVDSVCRQIQDSQFSGNLELEMYGECFDLQPYESVILGALNNIDSVLSKLNAPTESIEV